MANTRNQLCSCGSGLKYKRCCGKLELKKSEDSAQPFPVLTAVRVFGDISVVVPDSLDLISPYVLREQEDWFEAELPFLRSFVRPGMSVIDIGANFGIYTLQLARLAGNGGRIWAFEPASFTAACLSKSVLQNRLTNVKVVQAALSDRRGTAALALKKNPELNSLTPDSSARTEKVRTRTLDECRKEFGWSGIDFVKLDAEGEEGNILRGGERFFLDESPLVMFEVRHDKSWHEGLVRQFADFGYKSYRLVPGLNLLIPHDFAEPLDRFQLNLFCCKRERAESLQAGGFLIIEHDDEKVAGQLSFPQWRDKVFNLPFAKKLWGDRGSEGNRQGADDDLRALELYVLSQAQEYSARERYAALRQAARLLESALSGNAQTLARLSTLARIMGDLGYRDREVDVLNKILSDLSTASGDPASEKPFLPACRRFEEIDTWDYASDWFLASVLEQLELKCDYSSYYLGMASIKRLEKLQSLGFQNAEMERRRQLVRMRFGVQSGPNYSPLLTVKNEQNRNPEYWRG